jgi:hypothetical protein
MANPEHLAILKQGVEVWNKWRLDNGDIAIDLHRANLSGANLSRMNLSRVDLSYSTLNDVNLINSRLCYANLSQATIYGAALCEADFSEANLNAANFWRSNLSGVNLFRANLSEAVLENADLKNALIGFTIFGFVDLSAVKNLEMVKHHASSSIGIDTLYYSQGNIPEVFLRGCGVPDQMIEYARSLTSTPIQYYSSFISYSHKDEELAQRIHNDLQAAGVRCWFAPHDLKIGDKIRPTIDESIRFHDKLLLILSKYSVQSDWVEHEVEHALDRERIENKNILFPVRLDESVMDSTVGWAGNVRRQRHIGDFTLWKDHDSYKRAFDRLLRDLKSEK